MVELTPKKKKRRSRKLISSEHILGNVPIYGFIIVIGGLAFFLCLNAYLAFFLEDFQLENSPFQFAVPLFRRIRGCASYGCVVDPPEFDNNLVLKAIASAATGDENTGVFPFGTWNWATLTRTSNRKDPPFNQDATVSIMPYRTGQTTSETDFIIGIFDGHGALGHVNAKHFAADIPVRLARKLNNAPSSTPQSTEWISQKIKETFIEADAEAPREMTLRGGCTSSVTLRRGDDLFFANVGDSRTLLVGVDSSKFQIVEQGPAPGVTMHYITRADKPHLKEELDRIHAAGGNVHIPPAPKNPNLSRVIVYSNTFNDTIGLAMSRSLGDYEWTVKGVISEPLVDVVDLHNQSLSEIIKNPSASLFVIAASDGLWDLRLKQWFAKQFAESFLVEGDPRRVHPVTKMHEVIVRASPKNEMGYRDDISAISVAIPCCD